MKCELSKKRCVPCQGGVPPLEGDELRRLATELGGDWDVVDEHHLDREYQFRNFREALEFTNRLA